MCINRSLAPEDAAASAARAAEALRRIRGHLVDLDAGLATDEAALHAIALLAAAALPPRPAAASPSESPAAEARVIETKNGPVCELSARDGGGRLRFLGYSFATPGGASVSGSMRRNDRDGAMECSILLGDGRAVALMTLPLGPEGGYATRQARIFKAAFWAVKNLSAKTARYDARRRAAGREVPA